MPTPSHSNVPHLHDPTARQVFEILSGGRISRETGNNMSWTALAATPFSQKALPRQDTLEWLDKDDHTPLVKDQPDGTPLIGSDVSLPAGVLSGRALVEADFPNVNSFLPCMFYGCRGLNAIYCAYGEDFGIACDMGQLHLMPRCFLALTGGLASDDSNDSGTSDATKSLYIGPRPLAEESNDQESNDLSGNGGPPSLDTWKEGMPTWVSHYVEQVGNKDSQAAYNLHVNALSPLDALGGMHDSELAAAINGKDFAQPFADPDWEDWFGHAHAPMLGVLSGRGKDVANRAFSYASQMFDEICERKLRYSITDELPAQQAKTGMYFSLLPTIRVDREIDGALSTFLHYFNPRHLNIFPSALMVNGIKMGCDYVNLWYVDFLEGKTKSESTIVLPPSPKQGKTRFLTLQICKLFDTIVKLADFSNSSGNPVTSAPIRLVEYYGFNESRTNGHVGGEVYIDAPVQLCMQPTDRSISVSYDIGNYYYRSVTHIADEAIVLPLRRIDGDEAVIPTTTSENSWQYSIGFPNVRENWGHSKFKNENSSIRQHINLGIGGEEVDGKLLFTFNGSDSAEDRSPIECLTCYAPSSIQSMRGEMVVLANRGWQGFSKVIFPINSDNDPRKELPLTFLSLAADRRGDFPEPVFYYGGTLYPRELFISSDNNLEYTPRTTGFPPVLCIKTSGDHVQRILPPVQIGTEIFLPSKRISILRVDISNRTEALSLSVGPIVEVLVVVADSASKKPEVVPDDDHPITLGPTPKSIVYDIPLSSDEESNPPGGYLCPSGLEEDEGKTRLRGQSLNCKLLVYSASLGMRDYLSYLNIWWLDTVLPRSCGVWLKSEDAGGSNNLPEEARAYLFKFSSDCEFHPDQWRFPEGRPVVLLSVPYVKFADEGEKMLPLRFSDLWFPNTDAGIGFTCPEESSIPISDNLVFHVYHTKKSEIASTDAIRLDYENVKIGLPSGHADGGNPLAGVIVAPYYSTGTGKFDSAMRELTCESINVTGLGDSFILFKDFTGVKLPEDIAEDAPTCLVGELKRDFPNYDESSLFSARFPTEDRKNITVTAGSNDLNDVTVVLPKFLGNKIFSKTDIYVPDSRLLGQNIGTITVTSEITTPQWGADESNDFKVDESMAPKIHLGDNNTLSPNTKLVLDGGTSDCRLVARFFLYGGGLKEIYLGENWTWEIYSGSNSNLMNLERITGEVVVSRLPRNGVFRKCPKLKTVTVHYPSVVKNNSAKVFSAPLFSGYDSESVAGFACDFDYKIVVDPEDTSSNPNVDLNIESLFYEFFSETVSEENKHTPAVTIDLSAVPAYVVKNITFPDFTNACGLATLNLILSTRSQFPGGDDCNYTFKDDGETKTLEVNEATPGHSWYINCSVVGESEPYFRGNVKFTGSSGN